MNVEKVELVILVQEGKGRMDTGIGPVDPFVSQLHTCEALPSHDPPADGRGSKHVAEGSAAAIPPSLSVTALSEQEALMTQQVLK
ncbi:hypothetical protein EYF80_022306 [Liparis tanakae]|uniref:Uncharacterized protein n=1 Tax=Liparis tanakae TaxID=230148 RepID=A0A4Z2HPH9_9TELE|nr:hypothetical protein EYF80_022306 [Liparis tanakae]